MKRADFRFADPLRVRWAEVDMQKVVFNGHYLMYVDTAMGNFWRALALPYEATLARNFREVRVVAEEIGYKIIEARK